MLKPIKATFTNGGPAKNKDPTSFIMIVSSAIVGM